MRFFTYLGDYHANSKGIHMNTPFTYSFHKAAAVTSMLFFGCTTLAVMAQTTQTAPTKPAAEPVQVQGTPAAPVRIAPAQQPANGQVGKNPINTNQSAPTSQNPNLPIQQSANGQVGSNPQNSDRSVPTSQFLNNQNAVPTSQTGTGTPSGVGYNNPGGIVNSDTLQNDTLNHVHYHYHYDSQGGFSGATAPGYAPTTYTDPSKLDEVNNPMMQQAYGPGNPPPMNVDAGNMFVNNPNTRVGGGGVPTTWNPFLNNGSGMLTYGSGGGSGVQGFND